MRWMILCIFLGLTFIGFSEEMEVYRENPDFCHPTIQDLQKIQAYLQHADRPAIKKLKDKEFIPREFKFIGETAEEMPQYQWLAVNCSAEERGNCIIIYASYNEKYPLGAE